MSANTNTINQDKDKDIYISVEHLYKSFKKKRFFTTSIPISKRVKSWQS